MCLATAALLLALGGDGLEELVERLRREPGDAAAWKRLAEEPRAGAALAAARGLAEAGGEAGWRALARLADRLGEYPLAVQAGGRLVAALLERGEPARAAEEELALARRHFRFGASVAERRALEAARSLLQRAGRERSALDDYLRRRELESRQRADPDRAGLTIRLNDALLRGDRRAEHTARVDLAYQAYMTRRFADGLAQYREVLRLHGPAAIPPALRARDQNGAARLALEVALGSAGVERERLLEETLAWAEAALRSAGGGTAAPDRDLLLRSHCVLAQLLEARGDPGAARAHHEEELRLVQEQRRSLVLEGDEALRIFHGERHHIFENFALHLARSGAGEAAGLERALAVSELGHVGALRELCALRGRAAPEWLERSADLAELRRRAGAAGAAVLVWWVGSHDAAVLAVTGEGARCHPLAASPEELGRALRGLARTAFSLESPRSAIERAGREAFDALLAPAWEGVARCGRLVCVGPWGPAPFAALVLPGSEPLERRFLAARCEVSSAPAVAALLAEAAPGERGPVVALGCDGAGPYDPSLAAHFRLERLRPLPGAAEEARAVARRLGGRGEVGRAATEEALRVVAGGAGHLHLAGHAVVDDESDARTALLLQPSGADDGLLTLGEVLELPLRARLVALSGCRTARGESYTGEGVGGLARCFLAAGARALLLTLAPLDDQKAPVFMERFLEAQARGASPVAALAAAQRHMLGSLPNAHPAFWAVWAIHGVDGLR